MDHLLPKGSEAGGVGSSVTTIENVSLHRKKKKKKKEMGPQNLLACYRFLCCAGIRGDIREVAKHLWG